MSKEKIDHTGDKLPSGDFCGCCGREITAGTRSEEAWFCRECQSHILPWKYGVDPWDRTYFAQHKADCPHQICKIT